MSAAAVEVHHRYPRCLMRLYDRAAAGMAAWSDFDREARGPGSTP